jgi:hypothetical protein
MATADNPLLEMTGMSSYAGDENVPDETFRDTVLPEFKQALTARRSIRVFDGEPIAEEVMRDCLRDATLAPSSPTSNPTNCTGSAIPQPERGWRKHASASRPQPRPGSSSW